MTRLSSHDPPATSPDIDGNTAFLQAARSITPGQRQSPLSTLREGQGGRDVRSWAAGGVVTHGGRGFPSGTDARLRESARSHSTERSRSASPSPLPVPPCWRPAVSPVWYLTGNRSEGKKRVSLLGSGTALMCTSLCNHSRVALASPRPEENLAKEPPRKFSPHTAESLRVFSTRKAYFHLN